MPTDRDDTVRILLVEDDEAVRRAEESSLSNEGFEVVPVDNGRSALDRLDQNGEFDIVLLDLDLQSEPDGLEVCRTIKRHPKLAHIPIMFVTGQTSPHIVAKAFEEGGDEFIAKPFKLEELLVRVRVLARKGREERWLIERARKLAEKVAERDDELDDLRRFAQDIVSSLPSSLLVIDAEGSILYVNAPILQSLQAEHKDVIGHKLSEFVRPECMNGLFGRVLDEANKTGRPARLRRIAAFFKGRPDRFSDVAVTAIEYAGMRQVLIVVEDVTEQARADAAVALERAKLDEIVNAMNAALCLIDPDRNIVWTNRTFDLWFGDTYGQPGRQAFCDKLRGDETWMEPVFGKAMLRRVAWNVFTAHGQRRYFANIIAPIKTEPDQPVTQALVLTLDVTEQETRVEQLSLLQKLSQFLQHTLDAQRLNHLILFCVTAGHALGFNRSFLFRHNRADGTLDAELAIGPTSHDEAHRIWAELSDRGYTLEEHLMKADDFPDRETIPLYQHVRNLKYSLDDSAEIIVRAAKEQRPQVVTDATHDTRVTEAFRHAFGCHEFVAAPMVVEDTTVGVILADNLFSGRAITDEHVRLLSLFAGQAALAIANADTFAELQMRMSQLRSAQDQIVHSEKLAAVGKMAAHVAHEIRNPLSTIGGFARSILKRVDNAERVERNSKVIVEEVTRLESLLKGVMDFSRPQAPILKPGQLNALVEKALNTHVEILKGKEIQATIHLDPELPVIMFDENQILQALQNLIRNSVEAMTNGGTLSLATEAAGDKIELSVRDSGIGIPPELQKRLFNPFVTSKPEGTGLGLAVTKKIVDDHGGQILCHSTMGEGTTFVIELPLQPPENLRSVLATAPEDERPL